MRRMHTFWVCKTNSPRSEKYSAFWFVTVRPTKHFLLKEKWLSSESFEIQVLEALLNLTICAFFWWGLWLQKPVENFLCVARIHSEYVKPFPITGECSARWIMTVRPTKHLLLKEKWLSSEFLKFKSLKLCQAPEYSTILCEFLAKTLTSEARRKVSMRRTHTFWVCKTFSYIRGI